mmetsp:Transcript_48435/g.154680  ORF Transcript_48435/g.154680 Transcript_48435/m.154680 type:complete len:268 (+) Transcript_48435:1001-1804(+)
MLQQDLAHAPPGLRLLQPLPRGQEAALLLSRRSLLLLLLRPQVLGMQRLRLKLLLPGAAGVATEQDHFLGVHSPTAAIEVSPECLRGMHTAEVWREAIVAECSWASKAMQQHAAARRCLPVALLTRMPTTHPAASHSQLLSIGAYARQMVALGAHVAEHVGCPMLCSAAVAPAACRAALGDTTSIMPHQASLPKPWLLAPSALEADWAVAQGGLARSLPLGCLDWNGVRPGRAHHPPGGGPLHQLCCAAHARWGWRWLGRCGPVHAP